MANSLFPAFFRLFMTTARAPHVQTIPTLAYNVSTGEFDIHSGGTLAAGTMIGDLVDAELPFFPATTTVNSAIIYTMDAPDAPPHPVDQVSFTGKIGTSTEDVNPAAMGTYIWRTSLFGLFKLVHLDAPVSVDFLPITSVPGSGSLNVLDAIVTASTHGFAGRDGGQPSTFIKATFKLNDELRHAYRLD